ncbi:MAG: M28 family peptidase [bacterium]|nr:M28 family peptidase [bacterium]
MAALRWSLGIVLLLVPIMLLAELTPVVIDQTQTTPISQLNQIGFLIHARSGNYLVGTLPDSTKAAQLQGCTRLKGIPSDFAGVYEIGDRALPEDNELRQRLTILFDFGHSLLIVADARQLNELTAVKIPFRAIAKLGRPERETNPQLYETDSINPMVGVILDQISPSSYQNNLNALQNFGTRNTYNPQCDSAAVWIQQQFQNMGLSSWRDTFEIGGLMRYNVLAQRPGTLHPERVLYLAAHYDATAGLPVLPEDYAPGADDDASGAALVLECARVISQFGFQNTIRFAIFAGNEQGLIGSENYLTHLPIPGETYLGALDADMVGYSGTDPWPPDLVIYSDANPASIVIANKINEAITTFLPTFQQPVIHQDASMVYADHAPFWDAGIPAVLAMEDEVWGNDLNPHYHSATDQVQYLDVQYALHSVEALLAATTDLAMPNTIAQSWLTADHVTIDDYVGNHNGQIEYSEGIHLTIPIINAGGIAAPNVNATLTESDPYITFSDAQENYGNIPAQDTITVVNAFTGVVGIDVPDLHQFDVAVSMTSGTNHWVSTIQMVAHAPVIEMTGLIVDDAAGGNNNGRLEPGETANLKITLQNHGTYLAQNLNATLTEYNPYLTVNTAINSYGSLQPDSSAQRNFSVTAAASSPAFYLVNFNLAGSAIAGWTNSQNFNLSVGQPVHLPTGPDQYGYRAFDLNDEPYGPAFSWIEIDPNQGGQGTLLNATADDQTFFVTLPFTFRYYGQDYTELSICTNGWIACGHRTSVAYANTTLPSAAAVPAMIAPYWDDLSPQISGGISYYFNAPLGLFIVEYYRVRDYSPNTDYHTFEVVLYDPAVYPTLTGDGNILIQYGQLGNTASCTVGIENHDRDDGIQYLYNTAYDSTAANIGQGMAILFTTGYANPNVTITMTPINPPIQIPAPGGSFQYNVNVHTLAPNTLTMDIWIMMRKLPDGIWTGPYLNAARSLPSGASPVRLRNQTIAGTLAPGTYLYEGRVGAYPDTAWSSSNFQFTKVVTGMGPWEGAFVNSGEDYPEYTYGSISTSFLPTEFKLSQNYPNPFNAETVIPLELPQRSHVKVEIYNLRGQRVCTAFDGVKNAGWEKVRFNAVNLASGMYFCRVTAEGLEREGKFSGVSKMVVLK